MNSFNLVKYIWDQMQFSTRTFGPGDISCRTAGLIDHIEKELREIEQDPSDLEEWIDVIILALDGAWRTGATPKDIVECLAMKQQKNMARRWPDWRTAEPGKAIEHDRTGERLDE